MAVVQPDYIETNKTPVENSTRLVGYSTFVGGTGDASMTNGSRLNENKVNSPGVFIGIDGRRN